MSYEGTPLESLSPTESAPGFEDAESIEQHAQAEESVMSAREAELLRTLDDIRPETHDQERILEALKERTLALSGPRLDLKVAAQTAALSVALEGILSGAESRSPESEAHAAQLLAKNPELAEMLMQRILGASESLAHAGAADVQGSTLIEGAKEVLREMEGSDTKLFKGLALRTAERVTRALISASTLGIGAVVYDSAKDLYVSLRARSALRTKQRLMGSAAVAAA